MSGFNVQLQLAGVLEWMSQQMAGCGGKTAVIGISGGKDSSTVAAMAVAAYGRDHVYGVLMPDGIQPDIDYSQALVEHLQIPTAPATSTMPWRGYCPSWSRRA